LFFYLTTCVGIKFELKLIQSLQCRLNAEEYSQYNGCIVWLDFTIETRRAGSSLISGAISYNGMQLNPSSSWEAIRLRLWEGFCSLFWKLLDVFRVLDGLQSDFVELGHTPQPLSVLLLQDSHVRLLYCGCVWELHSERLDRSDRANNQSANALRAIWQPFGNFERIWACSKLTSLPKGLCVDIIVSDNTGVESSRTGLDWKSWLICYVGQ
jgi:hypothetical protein